MATQLSSNLSFRHIPHLIPTLKNIDTLIVSVSGHSQPVYRINHRGGNIENVKKQLDIIADAKSRSEISTDVIIRYFNFPYSTDEFPLFEKFAEERNLKILLWKASGEPQKRSPNAQRFWDYVYNGASQQPSLTPPNTGKLCYTALQPFNIDYKGDAYICCTTPNCERTRIGNFLDDDFDVLMYRRLTHFLCKNCTAYKPVDAPSHYAGWMIRGMLKEYGISPAQLPVIGKEEETISDLAGREVSFWGCGGMLHRKMHEYSSCKPRYILSDLPTRPEMICGIPVRHPDEVLDEANPLPIVIFAGTEAEKTIRQKINSAYPAHKEIYACATS